MGFVKKIVVLTSVLVVGSIGGIYGANIDGKLDSQAQLMNEQAKSLRNKLAELAKPSSEIAKFLDQVDAGGLVFDYSMLTVEGGDLVIKEAKSVSAVAGVSSPPEVTEKGAVKTTAFDKQNAYFRGFSASALAADAGFQKFIVANRALLTAYIDFARAYQTQPFLIKNNDQLIKGFAVFSLVQQAQMLYSMKKVDDEAVVEQLKTAETVITFYHKLWQYSAHVPQLNDIVGALRGFLDCFEEVRKQVVTAKSNHRFSKSLSQLSDMLNKPIWLPSLRSEQWQAVAQEFSVLILDDLNVKHLQADNFMSSHVLKVGFLPKETTNLMAQCAQIYAKSEVMIRATSDRLPSINSLRFVRNPFGKMLFTEACFGLWLFRGLPDASAPLSFREYKDQHLSSSLASLYRDQLVLNVLAREAYLKTLLLQANAVSFVDQKKVLQANQQLQSLRGVEVVRIDEKSQKVTWVSVDFVPEPL